ncbi:2-oxo-tetronate isomerase [Iodidimonas sp. SYSU 1G8]|uniref:2-oxo-tetronate isomerase n=1 Tax=Iodidimonas sp. SYSU 1G8 TaxID=3133967 RepID=UPI0031FE53B4
MFRFAANLSFLFGDAAFLDRFERAARAGFTGVEYLFPYDHDPAELVARLRDNRLEQVLFNAPPGDWTAGERGLAALPGREAEFAASLDTALRYAEAMDTRRVHIMAGIGGAPQVYRGNLEVAARRFEGSGVTALIEPINRRDMPGYFLADFAQAVAVIDAVASDSLRLQFDIYHRQILHGDVTTGLSQTMPIIGHVQIAGVPSRHEPDTGELALDQVLGTLRSLGYDGWIGCEYRPRGLTEDGLAWKARWETASAARDA